VLYDLGLVSNPEPFQKLVNQGMILGEDGEKMSKSRGNVINPDEIIRQYGADTLRMYEMFMGPLTRTKPWSTSSIDGIHRFLNRVWNLFIDENGSVRSDIQDVTPDRETLILLNKTIYKVTSDTENLRFNTAIAQFMIFINEIQKLPVKPKFVLESFLHLLNPFAPHISEELWEILGNSQTTLAYLPWQDYDKNLLIDELVTIAVQINGKVRGSFEIIRDTDDEICIEQAMQINNVKRFLENRTILKKFVIKNRLVSFVLK
jgi:leucyl-tRNA synthetase